MSDTFTRDSDGEKFELAEELYDHGHKGYVIKPAQAKRWRAEKGQMYWSVGEDGSIESYCDWYFEGDSEGCYELGNYFKTREQAEAAAEAVKALFEYIQTPLEHTIYESVITPKLDDVIVAARKAVQNGLTEPVQEGKS